MKRRLLLPQTFVAALALCGLSILAGGGRAFAWGAVLLALAAWVALWALARSADRAIKELADAAARLAEGGEPARLRGFPPGDLGRLAGATNALAGTFRAALGDLSAERNRLATILGNMVEAVVAVDQGGMVIAVNPALGRLFGVDARAAVGRPLVETLRHSQLAELIGGVLGGGEARSEELKVFTPEERVFEAHVAPLKEEDRRVGALLVLHDITRLRALEQLRKDFVANVSHELRTPLASIQGFAETLRSGGLEDVEHRLEFVEAIEQDARRLTRLVDDLLDLSSIESGKRTPRLAPLSFRPVAEEAAAGLRPLAAARRVSIELELPGGLPKVLADPDQLRQVLTNLLDNAVKFNREGGRVVVSARPEGGRLTVSVRDTGAGIPAADLPRVFERFYRVEKARSRELGGTGLGLAIVKHIVEAHGGSVAVESVEGAGSTFMFTLPLDERR